MDIDARLAAATPVAQDVVDAVDLHGADELLLDEIVGTGGAALTLVRTPRRARRHAVRTAALAVAALAVTAAGWATIEARTGRYGGGASHEERGGEIIRLDAPNAPAVVDEVARTIPLPPGRTFAAWKAATMGAQPDRSGERRGVVMTESAIATSLSLDAACQWTAYWLDAHARGDTATAAAAVDVLDDIPSWPAIVDADADGVRALLRKRAEGARAGEPTRFLAEYQTNCPQAAGP